MGGIQMTKSTVPGLVVALLTLGLLAGCSAPASGDPLSGTNWVLASFDNAAPLPGRPITLSFESGEVRGSSGCNSYFGTYAVDDDSLTITEVGATAMACLEPELMEQETAYLLRLASVRRYMLSDDRLQLFAAEDQTLSFDPQP
jgi:heat shock protein HslJ